MVIRYCFIREIVSEHGSKIVAFLRKSRWSCELKNALIVWLEVNAPHIGIPGFEHQITYSRIGFSDEVVSIENIYLMKFVKYYCQVLMTYDVVFSDGTEELRIVCHPLTEIPGVFNNLEYNNFIVEYPSIDFHVIIEYEYLYNIFYNLRYILSLLNNLSVQIEFSENIKTPIISISDSITSQDFIDGSYESIGVYVKTIKALHPDWSDVLHKEVENMKLLLPAPINSRW